MSYAAFTDVTIRYRPIETMIGSGQFDVASVDVSSVFIAQAESMVDAYIGRRYVVPLSYCPPLITQITADLAVHSMLAEKLPQVPEFIDKRYERCMDILKKLAEGEMTLGNSVSVVGSTGDNFAWANGMDYHPIFDPALDAMDQTADADRVAAAKSDRLSDVSSV